MYQPNNLDAKTLPELINLLRLELGRIALEFSQPTDYFALKTLYAAPSRILEGMVVKAKAPWDPGAGDGIYAYINGAWVKL